MPNNKISQALLEGAANEELLLKQSPHDDQIEEAIREAREWAAQIDRLVEAAKKTVAERSEGPVVGFDYDAIRVGSLDELTATLRDIELECPLKPQPTYRPYTPAEAVQFLGRTLRSDIGSRGEITSVAKNGAYVQSESHEVHHGVHMQSLIDWKTLCDHWVIHDTGEVCGMKEEA